MNFDYAQIFSNKTYTQKDGQVKAYSTQQGYMNLMKTVIDYLLDKKADFNDHVAVKAFITEHPDWNGKTIGEKVKLVSKLIKVLDDEQLAELKIDPTNRDTLVEKYAKLGSSVVKANEDRAGKKKRKYEENIWSTEEHREKVQEAVQVIRNGLEKGIASLTDPEKKEFQQAGLVLCYGDENTNTIRALHHTIRTDGYNEYSNFLLKPKRQQHYNPIMTIVYNDHKTKDNDGVVTHFIDYEKSPDLYNFIEAQCELWKSSSYLFNNYDTRTPFTDQQFRKYLCTAHGGLIGARLLRVMQSTKTWEHMLPLAEIERICYERGHPSIKQDAKYAR